MTNNAYQPKATMDNRPSDTAFALIKRIHDAVKDGFINEPFTAKHIVTWMHENNICKEDGTQYKAGYVTTLLSNSYIGKKNKSNRNSVWLDRRENEDGIFEYWFVD